MRACCLNLLTIVLKISIGCSIAHLLKHPVTIFWPEVVNSVFAVGHLADWKLPDCDVWLGAVDLADCNHELGGQIAIRARQSWHASLARGHGYGVPFVLSRALE